MIDRDEETRKLLEWAVGGHYVRLYAPRVNEMDAILRSHIQHQGDVASYVFSGSEPGTALPCGS